mgnify:CR=1 FL=1
MVKLTTFKGSYNQVARMAKINAGEHSLCIGYIIYMYIDIKYYGNIDRRNVNALLNDLNRVHYLCAPQLKKF